jgi:hypothetical protein
LVHIQFISTCYYRDIKIGALNMKRSFSILLGLALATSMMAVTASESFARGRTTTCKIYAKRQADRNVNRSVGTGLVLGSGTGLLIGGVTRGHRGLLPGLAIGAIGGGVLGAISGTEQRKRIYRRAFNDCMNNY